MTFAQWLDTLISEKGLDPEQMLTVPGPADSIYGDNFMPLSVVLSAMKGAPSHERKAIKDMLVRIDFKNGDIMHFIKYLAQAIAV